MAEFTFRMLLSPHQISASLSEFSNTTDTFYLILKQETENKLFWRPHDKIYRMINILPIQVQCVSHRRWISWMAMNGE